MATFQLQIEGYTGTESDTTFLSDKLTDGAKMIIDLLPESKHEKYSVDLADAGSGVSITGYRFIKAHKSGYPAMRVDSSMQTQILDSNSLHYAATKSPVFYIESGKVYIKPGSGTAVAIAYPTVLYGATSITNFPPELNHAVVLYGAIQTAIKKQNEALSTLIDETDIELRKAETERQMAIFGKYKAIAEELNAEFQNIIKIL